ncbi:recombinase family protein [Streptomonospora salina]|uniref:DNA invertase Pin-like site-specific DNA recombinase n=1 Tax=Streptomonospora salina TaxID=104205 RepID=A0A841EHF1_9ACTN|nr:recombinase family protein [Streptomonospora salina]MBB6000258.1 DNA invertase Pin-like site-specific DNA recombinase [Streptomonospora salina]
MASFKRRAVTPIDLGGLPLVPYARISRDAKGRETGVNRQDEEMRFASEEQKVALLDRTFKENDMSAAWDAPERPVWTKVFAMLESGDYGGLAVWDVDRAVRDGWLGESLIRMVRQRGFTTFLIWSPDDRYDLATDKGVTDFRDAVNRAEREIFRLRRRVKVTMRTKARHGEILGGSPRRFGFIDVYANEHHPAEADAMRRAAAWLLDKSWTVRQCLEKWEEEGIRTVTSVYKTGKRKGQTRGGLNFDHAKFRDVMMRPINVGVITADGKSVGRLEGDPIFDQRTYDRLIAYFTARTRGRPVQPARDSLLGGLQLVWCSGCRSTMTAGWVKASQGHRRHTYRCNYNGQAPRRAGCYQVITASNLEAMVVEATLAWWADPDRGKRDAAMLATMTSERKRLEEQVANLDASVDALMTKMASGSLPADRFQTTLDTFTAQRAPLATRLEELRSADTQAHAVITPERAAQMWEAASLEERQHMVTAAIREVWVHKTGKTGNRFDRRRVTVIAA